jgi:hypothetical protein
MRIRFRVLNYGETKSMKNWKCDEEKQKKKTLRERKLSRLHTIEFPKTREREKCVWIGDERDFGNLLLS